MNNKNTRNGLVSISFRKHTPREILLAMRSADLRYIEWGSDIHAPANDLKKIGEVARLQAEYGIECSSYGTYFRLGETPISELPSYIAAAKILGTSLLRLWCGTKSGAETTEEEKEKLFSACKEAAEIAEREEVTLALECHVKTFTERPEDALLLMKEINSPHLQMYWQPNQFRREEENLASAKMLSPYVRVVHVFNWEREQKKPLCEAVEIWKKYLSCFDGSQKLLLEFMPSGRLDELSAEAHSLKKIAE